MMPEAPAASATSGPAGNTNHNGRGASGGRNVSGWAARARKSNEKFRGYVFTSVLVASVLTADVGLAQSTGLTPANPSSAPVASAPAASAPVEELPNTPQPTTQPGGATISGGPSAPSQLSKEEVAELRTQFDALSKEGQDEMKAYYKDFGLDLDVLLGLSSAATAAAARVQQMLEALKSMD